MADPRALDLVFGSGEGTTAEVRAAHSNRVFVRSLDQIAEDNPRASGRRLTAREAFEAYGFDKLLEVATEGSAPLAQSADAAGLPIRTRREQLGLDTVSVARRARVTPDEVIACEASRRIPLRTYEKIGRALGLDERYIAVVRQPRGNEQLAVRLRTVGGISDPLGPAAVSALAEASWVAATQGRLAAELDLGFANKGIAQNRNFGVPGYPPYRWGYTQAANTREILGLGHDEPIPSMRELVEETFRIPLVQSELGESIAGATVEVGNTRAIIVNLSGLNQNAYMRRTTMAHELGHLLFDPTQQLDALRVDGYEELTRSNEQIGDAVEQRANAFAVELLAPREAVLAWYEAKGDLFDVIGRFGVGPTVARHQIRNASAGDVSADSQRIPNRHSDEWRQLLEWQAAESFTLDFHPVPDIRPSRAGRFGAIAVRAAEERLVSWDTVASWLDTSEKTVRKAVPFFREVFPGVW